MSNRYFTIQYYNADQWEAGKKMPQVYEFAKEVKVDDLGGLTEKPVYCINLGMNGEPRIINEGDWVITDDDGTVAVLPNIEFKLNFFPATRISKFLTETVTEDNECSEKAF